jgi:hypothetical protein
MEEARVEAENVLQLDPDFTIERTALTTIAFKHGEHSNDCFDAMRKAGLPER